MSYEEQKAQSETINKIAEEISLIKRWWPIILFLGSLVAGSISLTTYLLKYDSSTAKRKDVEVVSKQVDELHTTIKDLSVKFTEHLRSDSLDKISRQREVDIRIQENSTNIERIFRMLEKRSAPASSYYTQKYSTNSDGTRHLQSVPHPILN